MAWSIANLFKPSDRDVAAHRLYQETVTQARKPHLYTAWGVPDTPLGRFDAIALHCFLVLNRLQQDANTESFSKQYSGAIFDDMDRSLREMGVGDLSVGKKIRKIAEGFYGRSAAYARALDEGEAATVETLKRNLYGEADCPNDDALNSVAAYVLDSVDVLRGQELNELLKGSVRFALLPGEDE